MSEYKFLNLEGLQKYHNNLKGYMTAPTYVSSWTEGKTVDSNGQVVDATPEGDRKGYLSNKFYMPTKFINKSKLNSQLPESGVKSIIYSYMVDGSFNRGFEFNPIPSNVGESKEFSLIPSDRECYFRWYIETALDLSEWELYVYPDIEVPEVASESDIDTIWSTDGGGGSMPQNS